MKKTRKTITKTLLCMLMFTMLLATAVFAQEPTAENANTEETAVTLGRNKTVNATLDADGAVYKVKTAAKKKAYYIYIDNPTEDRMYISVYKKAIDDKSEEGFPRERLSIIRSVFMNVQRR